MRQPVAAASRPTGPGATSCHGRPAQALRSGTGARPAAPAVRAVPAAGAVGKQLASLPAVPVPALVLLAAAAAMFGFLTWWLSDKRRSSLWKVRPAACIEAADSADVGAPGWRAFPLASAPACALPSRAGPVL